MSVLNKMLKDLEQRQGQLPQNAGIPHGVQVLGQAPRSRVLTVVILTTIGLMVVASAMIAWWMLRDTRAITSSSTGTITTTPAPIPVPMAAVAMPSSASLALAVPASAVAAAPVLPIQVAKPLEMTPKSPLPAPSSSAVSVAAPALPKAISPPADAHAPAATKTIAANTNRPAPEQTDLKQTSAAQTAEFQYQQALTSLQAGRPNEAEALLRTLLQNNARHQPARHVLAGLLINERKNDAAEQVLREGQQLSPSDLDMAMTLARLQVERGDNSAAIDTLQFSLPHAGDSGNYLAFKASLHQKQKGHALAAMLLGKALQTAPGNGKWLLALAVSQQAQGQAQAARSSATAALSSGNLPRELLPMAQQMVDGSP